MRCYMFAHALILCFFPSWGLFAHVTQIRFSILRLCPQSHAQRAFAEASPGRVETLFAHSFRICCGSELASCCISRTFPLRSYQLRCPERWQAGPIRRRCRLPLLSAGQRKQPLRTRLSCPLGQQHGLWPVVFEPSFSDTMHARKWIIALKAKEASE